MLLLFVFVIGAPKYNVKSLLLLLLFWSIIGQLLLAVEEFCKNEMVETVTMESKTDTTT